MVPILSPNGSPKPTLSDPGLKPHFGTDFERDFRSILDSKTDLKIIKNRVWWILESVLIFRTSFLLFLIILLMFLNWLLARF